MEKEMVVEIQELKNLLKNYDVEVESPDGFIPVNFYIEKGEFDEYVLETSSGLEVKSNAGHLYETSNGWVPAHKLVNEEFSVLTKNGFEPATITSTGNKIPIVDINVKHENHRYYTNEVSSHNTGVGKSLVMCHMAGHHLISGNNVLYISMEMGEERLAERVDSRLFNVPISDVKNINKDSFNRKITKIKEKTTGRLVFKEFPTGAAHVGHFRALIEELKVKKDFTPRVIYIDYLNICASSRMKMGGSVNSYAYIKSIAEEIRGLAVEYDVPIITATQTNRTGSNSSDPNLEDTSESFGLPMTVDLMLALVSGEELEELGQIMWKQLKNRYGDLSYYKKFVTGIDKSKMMLFNLEDSAQETILNSGKPAEEDKPLFDKSTDDKFNGWKI